MMKKNQNNQNFQPNKNMQRQSEEFGYETDVTEVQKQNAKAEQKKSQASGNYTNNNNQNASE
ncbi:gamma-type small acid-soluble spore protein [Lysinibacillus parviboronicapiens]|uniref:gamma-type small acid-soluble spore protein n=1 Tax=Lysinibacillus parviboronicapiens TaxID=436516 RepID=UPI001EE70F46|nr:gamma-type small acid-soluble spore protein [Lysinibacillus parviboronicapiens]